MGARFSIFSYPDRTNLRRHYERVLTGEVNNLNSKDYQANKLQTNVNNVVADKNRYNKLTGEYKKEQGTKSTTLSDRRTTRRGLETDIKYTNDEIDNTYYSADGTKSLVLGAVVTKRATEKRIDSTYNNTEERNKDIYYGMNRTNNSLLKTITATKNNHTADISKVTYQTDQTSYFSWLNNMLLSLYLILWVIFAFILYRIKGNISTFIKVITMVSLLLFPFFSIIYYKIYIAK